MFKLTTSLYTYLANSHMCNVPEAPGVGLRVLEVGG